MANSDRDEDNPYASPKGIVEGPGRAKTEKHLDQFVIEPWRPPRDWIDNVLALLLRLGGSLLLFLVFAGICAAACWRLGGPEPEGVVIGLGIGLLLVLPAAIYEMLCRLHGLRIDAAGVVFKHGLGKLKFLTWEEILAIRPATRWEVLIHAWLWLWLEPTKSESTSGHYRIEWSGGFVYFPPNDPVLFEKAVRKFCPRLLGNE